MMRAHDFSGDLMFDSDLVAAAAMVLRHAEVSTTETYLKCGDE